MRRYLLFYLSAVFVFCVFLFGGILWMNHADQQNGIPFDEEIVLYTTIPQDQANLLASSYQRMHHVKVELTTVTEEELLTKMQSSQTEPFADVVLTSSIALKKAEKAGLTEQLYEEQFDMVSNQLKSTEDRWVGVWYDPFVIGLNRDFMVKLSPVPRRWSDIVQPHGMRVVMTDFLMADASAHFLFSYIAKNGQQASYDWLKRLHPNIVSYAKYLSTPSSMIGIGEADAAVTLQSEAIRYIHDGFPIALVYPKEGSPYCLTCCAVMKDSEEKEAAKRFRRWLLSEEAQLILQEQNFFFVPTDPTIPSYHALTYKPYSLWETNPFLTKEEKYKLLDKWVQEIRLAK